MLKTHTHPLRGVGFGEDGRCYMVDRLGEEFAGHGAFLETGGTQAAEQVEIVEVGDLANEGCRSRMKGIQSAQARVISPSPVCRP